MNARVGFIAVLGCAVALAACGSTSKTAKPTSTTSATTTTAVTTTTMSTARLDAMLLGLKDVGVDWQVGPNVNAADFSDSTQIPCKDVTMNPTIIKRLTPVTGIQFEPKDHSRRHMIEFALTGDPKRLGSDLQAFFGAMESCSTSTSTSTPPSTGTLTVKKFTIPRLGDQRAAYTLIGTETPGSQQTWYVRSAAVRVNSVAIEVGLTEILTTPHDKPHISDGEFVQVLTTAVSKLSG